MNQNKSFFILTLVLAALLAVIFYSTKQSDEETSNGFPGRTRRASVVTHPAANPALEQLKEQEFLGLNAPQAGRPEKTGNDPQSSAPVVSAAVLPASSRTNGSLAAFNPSLMSSGQFPRVMSPSYATADNPSLYNQATQNLKAGVGLPSSYSSAPQRAYQMEGNFAPTTASGQADEKAGQALFSPYMAALTKEESAKLEKTLDGLTDRVEEAVLRALLPKSKKDANIEKYLSRNFSADGKSTATTGAAGATAETAGPFAAVARQISRQKNSLVKNMQSAFGAQAAAQAGQLMDSYQQELMSVLNQTNLSPEERQAKTRQISKKYNDKLKNLSAQKGKEQLQQNLNERDGKLLVHYQKTYDAQTAAALGDIMDASRAREMALAEQDLTRDEYFEQAFALYRERDAQMRKYLTDNNKSFVGYNSAQQQDQSQQEDELPIAYRASEKEQQTRHQDIAERSNSLLKDVRQRYGEEGVAVFQEIHQQYADEMDAIWADPETTIQEKEKLSQKALKKNNDTSTRAEVKLHEERAVEALRQTMQGVAPEIADQMEQHVRSVFDETGARIDEILNNPDLSEQQRQQQVQEAYQDAQRQLTGK